MTEEERESILTDKMMERRNAAMKATAMELTKEELVDALFDAYQHSLSTDEQGLKIIDERIARLQDHDLCCIYNRLNEVFKG